MKDMCLRNLIFLTAKLVKVSVCSSCPIVDLLGLDCVPSQLLLHGEGVFRIISFQVQSDGYRGQPFSSVKENIDPTYLGVPERSRSEK